MPRARRFHCYGCYALTKARDLVFVIPDPKAADSQLLCPGCASAYTYFLEASRIPYGTVTSGPLPPVPKGTIAD